MSSSSLPRPWRETLRAHLALARVSNSPTVVSNALAGAALGGGLSRGGTVLLLAVAMVLFYTAGMYLNDVLDYATDSRERPERPLPSGRVSRTTALLVVVALFACGSLLLLAVGPAPLVSGLILTALIVFYDAWHKTNPYSPLLMASTRAFVYITAFVAFGTGSILPFLLWTLLLALYIVGLTYIAKTERKPDLSRYWPAALLFLPAVFALPLDWSAAGLALLALFVGWVLISISHVYRARIRDIGRVIALLIAGVSLVDGLVLSVTGYPWAVPLALIAFVSTLLLQRYIKGT